MTLVGVVRAEFLRARNFDYVRAARALGVRDAAIMRRHLLPNAMTSSLTFLPFITSGAVVTLTALDFLGFGLPPGSPSLGELLLQGKNNLRAPWLGITGFVVIALMLTLLVFIGEAVRDAFDPRRTLAAVPPPPGADPSAVSQPETIVHPPTASGATLEAPLMRIEDLRVSFGATEAVAGLSLDLRKGETLALVGESGSGKSVTALSILQLLVPSARVRGSIRFQDRELVGADGETMRAIRGDRIAMIFQEPMTSLNPVLSIGRQLTEGLEIHMKMKPPEARARAIELLAMVGIPDPERRLAQYPHHFSGGMRQRMMIAMALACNPSLILADEPTTALDVTIQAQILELLRDLARRLGVAMLIITHNLGVVARYADRVNVMYAGRIIERASAAELYARPRHPYTLGLLRSVPRLDEPRRARLDPIEGQPPDVTRLPPGCSFAPRCAFRVARCTEEAPALEKVDPDHLSACWESARLVGKQVTLEDSR